MSSSRRVLFAAALIGACAVGAPAPAQDGKVARSFGAGDGVSAVGVLDAPPDTEIEGPQAIASGDNGEIYLLDQVNSRVVAFEPGKPEGLTRSLSLPEGVQPTDMVVTGGRIYVWDGKPIRLNESGEGATRSLSLGPRASDDVDDVTRSMFGQMGSEVIEGEAEPGLTRAIGRPRAGAGPARVSGKQMVASKGKGPVSASVIVDKTEKAATMTVATRDGARLGALTLRVRDRIGTAELLDIDKQGRFFVLAENISAAGGANSFVARFTPAGALEGVFELPLNPEVALSRRFVTVNPEGDVFFMRTRKGVVDVIGVGFTAMAKGQVVDLGPPPVAAVAPADPRKTPVSAVRPLTREQVIRTALAFADVRWRVTPTAYGGDPDLSCNGFNARVRRPSFMIGKTNQEVKGIPYCWGCMGSLNQIAGRINAGTKAGNVCTRNDPTRDVAGVDCSAFVSATWGLSTHFTTLAIPSITVPVTNPWDMKPGDALNKPGSHVMLFTGFTPDRKIEVIEASPGACAGKVCRNVYTLASLLARGYTARRYRALVDEVAMATPAPRPARQRPARDQN
ncbi:MAG: hypothetical protein JNK46_06445 [Methylobacteriaceae bacterium]|nr:hypothetical protein [Methylobacteriaceae bacterium]